MNIKSYTDILQSRKLAEILPLESADMYYGYGKDKPEFFPISDVDVECLSQSCWSLAALLGVLTENKICHYDNKYYCQYISEGGEFPFYSTAEYDNPVDACVAMIEKLHELNLL